MIVSQIIFFLAVALVIIILLRRATRGESLGESVAATKGKLSPIISALGVIFGKLFAGLSSSTRKIGSKVQSQVQSTLEARQSKEIFQPTPIENRPTHEFWQSDYSNEKNELPTKFDEGEKLIKEGKNDEAEQFFVRLASNHPSDPKIYARLGLLYLNAKNFSDAIEALKVAVKLDKYNPSRHYNLALAYVGNNDTQRAISAVREAISLDPVTQKYRTLLEQLLNRE